MEIENEVGSEVGPNTQHDAVNRRASRPRVFKILFSRFVTAFSFIAISLSFFLPPNGIGFEVCWFKRLFQLPCPSCGLTRSITCISHLRFADAWGFQPFGFVLYAVFVANIFFLFSPIQIRRRIYRVLLSNNSVYLSCYWLTVFGFLLFGTVRILLISLDSGFFRNI